MPSYEPLSVSSDVVMPLFVSRHIFQWFDDNRAEKYPSVSRSSLSSDSQQVSARANNRRLGFQGAGDGEQVVPRRHVVPAAFEIANQPSRTFDTEHCHFVETGRSHFPCEILRAVEIGRREIVDAARLVAMLT